MGLNWRGSCAKYNKMLLFALFSAAMIFTAEAYAFHLCVPCRKWAVCGWGKTKEVRAKKVWARLGKVDDIYEKNN